ncbi:MAG: Twitching motility protein PilT [Myxococcaceae bacterium]|nr:Twitching motility protein PilT [Myxococcaceae bacterium]
MVRHIDRFIAAMRREEADELLFATGEPVRVRTGEQTRVVLAQGVRSEQILAIAVEFAPPGLTAGLTVDGETCFDFEAPGGPISARFRRRHGRLEVALREQPAPVAAKTLAPPPPDAPAASVPPPKVSAPAAAEGAPTLAGPRIDGLLRALIELGASDLHLTAGMQPRVRVDGDMRRMPGAHGEALGGDEIEALLQEVAPPEARARFAETRDADFAYEIPALARFRVNVFRDRRGVSGVLRVIPPRIRTADELGLPAVVRDFCHLPKGLVLVTGPTGSGKSTTLAAMIDLINESRPDHIITIEDPVEFVHESKSCLVNQREVYADTRSFAAALRAALREDPDIVLVGELRDLETTSIAIETAETGHLVFATLHTNTAISTVDRIIDQFPADRQAQVRAMLAVSLRGVIAQTLCKRVGGGRVAAMEVLVSSHAVANLIREGKTFQLTSVMQTQRQAGNQTMNDALLQLVQSGVVTPQEALAKAVDRHTLRGMIDRDAAEG